MLEDGGNLETQNFDPKMIMAESER
jgi:hypothetical protein